MRSTELTWIALAAALLLGAGSAHAKDLCVYRDDGTILAQLRAFRAPQKGKCRNVVGNHANGTLHGGVCRTSDGNTLRFATTTNVGAGLFSPPKVRQHNFSLAYPALDAGSGSQFTTEGGIGTSTTEGSLSGLHAAACTAGAIL